eukprot:scaffold1453_cov195-Amphora_coffeaeformis.AAC.13
MDVVIATWRFLAFDGLGRIPAMLAQSSTSKPSCRDTSVDHTTTKYIKQRERIEKSGGVCPVESRPEFNIIVCRPLLLVAKATTPRRKR